MRKILIILFFPSFVWATTPNATPLVPVTDPSVQRDLQGITQQIANISQIKGTTTNDNATVGYVGEYKESLASGNHNLTPSAQWVDILNLTLTPGDWMITSGTSLNQNGATGTGFLDFGISPNSGNTSSGLNLGQNFFEVLGPSGSNDTSAIMPPYRISISTTTTYYFKLQASFTGGPPVYQGGRLSAWRVR